MKSKNLYRINYLETPQYTGSLYEDTELPNINQVTEAKNNILPIEGGLNRANPEKLARYKEYYKLNKELERLKNQDPELVSSENIEDLQNQIKSIENKRNKANFQESIATLPHTPEYSKIIANAQLSELMSPGKGGAAGLVEGNKLLLITHGTPSFDAKLMLNVLPADYEEYNQWVGYNSSDNNSDSIQYITNDLAENVIRFYIQKLGASSVELLACHSGFLKNNLIGLGGKTNEIDGTPIDYLDTERKVELQTLVDGQNVPKENAETYAVAI